MQTLTRTAETKGELVYLFFSNFLVDYNENISTEFETSHIIPIFYWKESQILTLLGLDVDYCILKWWNFSIHLSGLMTVLIEKWSEHMPARIMFVLQRVASGYLTEVFVLQCGGIHLQLRHEGSHWEARRFGSEWAQDPPRGGQGPSRGPPLSVLERFEVSFSISFEVRNVTCLPYPSPTLLHTISGILARFGAKLCTSSALTGPFILFGTNLRKYGSGLESRKLWCIRPRVVRINLLIIDCTLPLLSTHSYSVNIFLAFIPLGWGVHLSLHKIWRI